MRQSEKSGLVWPVRSTYKEMRGGAGQIILWKVSRKINVPQIKKKKSNASKTETKKQSNMKSHVRTNKAGGLVLLLKKKNPSFD